VAGAAGPTALFPQLFPIPDPGYNLVRQRESQLTGEHTDLTAMVRFVRKHVAQHFDTDRPGRSPAVSVKLRNPSHAAAHTFGEHLCASRGAFGQSGTGLLRRAMRAVELWRDLQVRCCKPDPFGADIVYMGEDRRDGADAAGRFGSPGGGIEMFDKNLIYAVIGGEDPDCGPAGLSVNLVWTRGHGSPAIDRL
jgi:hypothetical protein